MTIADFNRGADLTPDLLRAFGASGIPSIDRLWRRPAATAGQRRATAVALYETLLAGASWDPLALLHRAVRSLPLDRGGRTLFYRHRVLRGRSADWADAIVALLIRLPLANVLYRGERYGHARPVIAACLGELLWATNVRRLDHHQYLATRMTLTVEVVEWFARNCPDAYKDIGLAISPLMHFLSQRQADGGLRGDTRAAVQRLYAFLDHHLDICEDGQGAWPSVHEYCLKALGVDRRNSAVWRLQDDLPGLVDAFRRSLARRIGPDLADRLLSDRDLRAADLRRDGDVTDTLLRLLRARDLWQGTVGLGRENSFDVLHRELAGFANWRGLNDLIRAVADVDAPADDGQMAELVRALPGSGAVVAEQIVPRALRCARLPGFPLTRQALDDLPAAGAMTTVPFFDETLAHVRRGRRA